MPARQTHGALRLRNNWLYVMTAWLVLLCFFSEVIFFFYCCFVFVLFFWPASGAFVGSVLLQRYHLRPHGGSRGQKMLPVWTSFFFFLLWVLFAHFIFQEIYIFIFQQMEWLWTHHTVRRWVAVVTLHLENNNTCLPFISPQHFYEKIRYKPTNTTKVTLHFQHITAT